MNSQTSGKREPPPVYTPKPSLLEPLSPQQTLIGPSHQRLLPGEDEQNFSAILPSPPLSPDAELPPVYTPLDEIAHNFTLYSPFIYATGTSTFARYQLQAEYTKSGKPYRLRIRRLLGSESRRLSLASMTSRTSTSSGEWQTNPAPAVRRPSIPYDDDTTIYTVDNASGLSLFTSSSSTPPTASTLSLRGRQRGTLQGTIRLSRSRAVHVTRNPAGDALRADNERRMQRRGYRPADEVREALLFAVCGARARGLRKRGDGAAEWRDADGRLLAVATAADGLAAPQLSVEPAVEPRLRDLLVTCWAARVWAAAGEAWREGEREEVDGTALRGTALRRAATGCT